MKKIKIFIFLLFLFLNTSCQTQKTFTLVNPGKLEVLNKLYSIETNQSWSQFQDESYNFIFWTVNGYSLDRIVFFDPIEDNTSLYDSEAFFSQESEKRPIFTSDMNKLEIKEFIVNCFLWTKHLTKIETENLKNYKIDDIPGITFDISGQNELGLNYKGFVIAGIKEKKLITMYFVAAEMEYFNKYKKEAKKILSSIKFL